MSYANILAFVEHLPYVENGVAVATRYAGHPVAKALFTAAGCGALTYFAFAEGALVVAFFSNPVVWVATGVGLAAGAISYSMPLNDVNVQNKTSQGKKCEENVILYQKLSCIIHT